MYVAAFNIKRRTPGFLAALGGNVTWVNESVWAPAFGRNLNNIYYWASRIIPLFAALRYNDSFGFLPKLPPLDVLYIRSMPEPYQSDWHVSLLRVALGGRFPAIEFTNGSWASQMSSNLVSPARGNNWKCFPTATLVSANWAAVRVCVQLIFDTTPSISIKFG